MIVVELPWTVFAALGCFYFWRNADRARGDLAFAKVGLGDNNRMMLRAKMNLRRNVCLAVLEAVFALVGFLALLDQANEQRFTPARLFSTALFLGVAAMLAYLAYAEDRDEGKIRS